MKIHKPFFMIREFHLADWFTLANAACGTRALFSMLTYLQINQKPSCKRLMLTMRLIWGPSNI